MFIHNTPTVFEATAQILVSAGIFLCVATTLYLLQRLLYRLSIFGPKTIYLSAVIGTPCHELSHFLLCFPFFHKVEKLNLFSPSTDGTLGYVSHSYTPRNPWAICGNFFIGIAPIFGGCVVILLTTHWLPGGDEILRALKLSQETYRNVYDLQSFSYALVSCLKQLLTAFLVSFRAATLQTLIWFYLSASIGLHLMPSTADLRGGFWGSVLTGTVLFGVKIILPDSTWHKLLEVVQSQLLSVSLLLTISIFCCLVLGFLLMVIAIVSRKLA